MSRACRRRQGGSGATTGEAVAAWRSGKTGTLKLVSSCDESRFTNMPAAIFASIRGNADSSCSVQLAQLLDDASGRRLRGGNNAMPQSRSPNSEGSVGMRSCSCWSVYTIDFPPYFSQGS